MFIIYKAEQTYFLFLFMTDNKISGTVQVSSLSQCRHMRLNFAEHVSDEQQT